MELGWKPTGKNIPYRSCKTPSRGSTDDFLGIVMTVVIPKYLKPFPGGRHKAFEHTRDVYFEARAFLYFPIRSYGPTRARVTSRRLFGLELSESRLLRSTTLGKLPRNPAYRDTNNFRIWIRFWRDHVVNDSLKSNIRTPCLHTPVMANRPECTRCRVATKMISFVFRTIKR